MRTSSSLYGSNSQETNLVLQALRSLVSGESEDLKSALAQSVDWPALLRIAERHSVLPLVAYALTQYGNDLVPAEIREQLHNRLLLASRTNLVLISEWSRILRAFDEAKIPVVSLKGSALALLTYPNFALREFNDIDLLVHPQDVPRASDLLIRSGYGISSPLAGRIDATLVRSRNSQLDFIHNRRQIRVDLHWGALHEMFSFQLPVELLFKSARIAHHEGISFLGLSPEHLLLYLCAHGAKHCWLNLRWLCDAAFHIGKSHDLDWELCIRTADASNCALIFQHSLLLVHRVLGVNLPPSVSTYCSCARSQALDDIATSLLLRSNGEISRRQELRFHLALANGGRGRARFLFERLFVPDQPDLRRHLPGPLQFLSYAAKPMRFLFSHLWNV